MSNLFESLSDTQKEVVFEREGKFVLRACPGSGKTYTVAARLAHKVSKWKKKYQGISTISFTNVAWQEIEKQIQLYFNFQRSIPYPHYLGTIDSFINRLIFLPFGHLVMKCNKRPILVGEPHGVWSGGDRYYDTLFDKITFNIKDELVVLPLYQRKVKADSLKDMRLKKNKIRLNKTGYATQADANYYALKILENYPNVSKAVVKRFPMLIVDEAQDTSDIQMRIIDNLIKNGLKDILLVGDPDQAIFEWNEAKPELFNKKYEEWYQNSLTLNENWRSSQNICDFTFNLSSLPEQSRAVNEDIKDHEFIPEIITYNETTIKETIDRFIETCREANIEISIENVAVLYRSKILFNEITGVRSFNLNNLPWAENDRFTRDFLLGKYLYDKGDFKKGFRHIELAVFKAKHKVLFCSKSDLEMWTNKIGFTRYRKLVYQLLVSLPLTNCLIGEWVNKTNEVFKSRKNGISLKIKKNKDQITFDEIFSFDNTELIEKNYKIGTIHSAKGETFSAVLLILRKKCKGNQYYKSLLKKYNNAKENEELRIVYVAITRPRQLLILAVPDDEDKKMWENKLLSN